MSQLPDPSTLDKFLCQGFGDASPLYVEQPQPTPRQISEYLVDPENWEGVLPPDQITVEGILGQRLQQYKCIFCWHRGRECWGEPCLNWWQVTNRRKTAVRIELRDTGGPMGLGVFAKAFIGRGTFLDDYVGELLPGSMWYPGDRYAFDLPGIGRCTAREYGNWTRFVNHRCEPNARANDWMVGQRVVMMFRAIRDIEPGEQLFIEYGRGYFESANRVCKCDVYPGDHLPPRDDFVRTDDARKPGETTPEQGRAAVEAKTVTDDSSLLGNSSPEQSTNSGQQAKEVPCRQKMAKRMTTPRAARTPRRQLTAGENRSRAESSGDATVAFFLDVQRQLQRTCPTLQPNTKIQTPRRSTRIQTPKAPRKRIVGPRGSVSDFLGFVQGEK